MAPSRARFWGQTVDGIRRLSGSLQCFEAQGTSGDRSTMAVERNFAVTAAHRLSKLSAEFPRFSDRQSRRESVQGPPPVPVTAPSSVREASSGGRERFLVLIRAITRTVGGSVRCASATAASPRAGPLSPFLRELGSARQFGSFFYLCLFSLSPRARDCWENKETLLFR